MKKSNVFKHYILTRYNYGIYDKPYADEWMENRFKLFEATRESVLSQEGEFQWIIAIDERTPVKIRKQIASDKRITLYAGDIRSYFDDFPEEEAEWVITTRFDNDDRYLPGAIRDIQSRFTPELKVVDIDYEQLQLSTGNRYTSERPGPNSPFLSLIEPSSYVKTAYCRPHYRLLDGYPSPKGYIRVRAEKINKVLAYMVIHKENMANEIVGRKL